MPIESEHDHFKEAEEEGVSNTFVDPWTTTLLEETSKSLDGVNVHVFVNIHVQVPIRVSILLQAFEHCSNMTGKLWIHTY